MTTTANPTKKLFRKLNRLLTDLAIEKMKAVDADPILQEAAENYNFEGEAEKACEKAVENYDFDGAIDDAVQDFDFSEAIEKHADFDGEAEKAVERAMDNYDLDEQVEKLVDTKLDAKLPAALEKALFALLERPDVQEKLVAALFDRAAA